MGENEISKNVTDTSPLYIYHHHHHHHHCVPHVGGNMMRIWRPGLETQGAVFKPSCLGSSWSLPSLPSLIGSIGGSADNHDNSKEQMVRREIFPIMRMMVIIEKRKLSGVMRQEQEKRSGGLSRAIAPSCVSQLFFSQLLSTIVLFTIAVHNYFSQLLFTIA